MELTLWCSCWHRCSHNSITFFKSYSFNFSRFNVLNINFCRCDFFLELSWHPRGRHFPLSGQGSHIPVDPVREHPRWRGGLRISSEGGEETRAQGGSGNHEAIRAFADRFHARSGGAIFSSRRIDGVEKIKKIALPTSDFPEDPPLNFPWGFKERIRCRLRDGSF